MNLWECEHAGCKVTATGQGSAVGLLAIGWFFQPGPVILCPAHHPEGPEAAERQAEHAQAAMVGALALLSPGAPDVRMPWDPE